MPFGMGDEVVAWEVEVKELRERIRSLNEEIYIVRVRNTILHAETGERAKTIKALQAEIVDIRAKSGLVSPQLAEDTHELTAFFDTIGAARFMAALNHAQKVGKMGKIKEVTL